MKRIPETQAAEVKGAARDDAEERLRVLGDLLVRGWAIARDLDAIRALPAPFLRTHSSAKHWPWFVSVRQEGRPFKHRLPKR